jgi:death on curing protein
MAAAYLFHICGNHPFGDGNKRTGADAAITFLLMKDWEPEFDEDELVELVLAAVSGVISKTKLTEEFEARSRPASSPIVE